MTERNAWSRDAQIAALVDDGKIVPVVDRTFPFADTRDALAYVESGRAVGKVVVVRPPTR